MINPGDFAIVQRRKRPSYLRKVMLWLKFYGYWHLAGPINKAVTVLTMLLKCEKRLYYLYSTQQLVEITAYNYLQRVKVDAAEYALIKTITPTGVSYTKGERF